MIGSAGLGIGYYVWRRGRSSAVVVLVYLVALGAVMRLWAPMRESPVALMAVPPLVMFVLHLFGVMMLETPDVLTRGSGYPAHLLTLPATTAALVAWPMAYMAAFVLVLSTLSMQLLLAPLEMQAPAYLPMATVCGAAWAQALLWCPSPLPGLRLILIGPVVLTIALSAVGMASGGWPVRDAAAVYVSLTFTAYLVARVGLAAGRRGDGQHLRPPARLRAWWSKGETRDKPPFRSAAAAQMWFEWRRTILVLPTYAAGSGVVVAVVAAISAHGARRAVFVPLSFGGIELSAALLFSATILLGPLLLSTMVSNLGRSEFYAKQPMLPGFLATRPMTTAGYAALKFRAVTWTTACVWAAQAIVLVLVLCLFPARDRWALPAVLYKLSGHVWVPLILLVGTLFAFTWRNAATQMWLAMAGRVSVVRAMNCFGMTTLALAGFLGYWLFRHPAAMARARPMGGMLIVGLAGVKVIASVGAMWGARRVELISRRGIALGFAGWLVVTAGVAAVTGACLPGVHHPVALAVLMVPLTRIVAAPLAMYWNRHR